MNETKRMTLSVLFQKRGVTNSWSPVKQEWDDSAPWRFLGVRVGLRDKKHVRIYVGIECPPEHDWEDFIHEAEESADSKFRELYPEATMWIPLQSHASLKILSNKNTNR
jgi:hypothetical protein